MKKTIRDEWLDFEDKVIPRDAPWVQRKEMKRAYYAGAWTMLMLSKELGDDKYTEESAVKILEKYESELKAFTAQVAKGKA